MGRRFFLSAGSQGNRGKKRSPPPPPLEIIFCHGSWNRDTVNSVEYWEVGAGLENVFTGSIEFIEAHSKNCSKCGISLQSVIAAVYQIEVTTTGA